MIEVSLSDEEEADPAESSEEELGSGGAANADGAAGQGAGVAEDGRAIYAKAAAAAAP